MTIQRIDMRPVHPTADSQKKCLIWQLERKGNASGGWIQRDSDKGSASGITTNWARVGSRTSAIVRDIRVGCMPRYCVTGVAPSLVNSHWGLRKHESGCCKDEMRVESLVQSYC